MNAATRYLKAYKKASHADFAFSKAIKDQFGQNANRYDHPVSQFNEQTIIARNKKIDADKELYIALGAMREAGLTINDAEHTTR